MTETPFGWVIASVGELGQVVSGGTPSTRAAEYWGGNVVWITPADLSGFRQKRISQGARCITRKGLANSSARLMPHGSILFSSRAPVGYVAIADVELCTNQGFKSLVPANGVSSDYLFYYFMSIRELATSLASGTTFKELSAKGFASLPVFLPPLVEQRVIVAKIEELFSELDKGIEQLQTVKQQLNQYRQAVLKAAFEGKLTAEWWAEQQAAGNLPDANELLEQIEKEREERYQQQLQEWKQAVVEWEQAGGRESGRKKPRKPTKPRMLQPLARKGGELGELPEGWSWSRLGAVGDVSGGLTKNSRRSALPLRFPYLRVANVYANRLELEEVHEIGATEVEYERTLLARGDLLFVEGNGSIDQIGRVAIWNGSIHPCLHQNHLIKCRSVIPDMAKFIMYWFLSHLGRSVVIHEASSTSGLHTLSISKVGSLRIPVACLAEQHRIVDEIESRFSVLDELDKVVDHGVEQAEALRQSILKKAFEGRLLTEAELAAVRNDPEYEPADQLLERIRAESG